MSCLKNTRKVIRNLSAPAVVLALCVAPAACGTSYGSALTTPWIDVAMRSPHGEPPAEHHHLHAHGLGASSHCDGHLDTSDRDDDAIPVAGSHFSVLPDVTVSPSAMKTVRKIAGAYNKRTGKTLVVTSGTRGPDSQADAMYDLLRLGTDIVALYRQKEAAMELEAAYDRGRKAGRARDAVVEEMASVIRRQMKRGIYISAHLRAGAVDIRNRNMSNGEKAAFTSAVREVGGVSLLEEASPPHYHLQIK